MSDDYERTITVTDQDMVLGIMDEGTITAKFRVKTISSRDDEMMGDEERVYYTLVLEDIKIDRTKPNLDQAAERAYQGSKPIRVKNSINPAP